jgi:hypothetical protein
MMNIFNNIANNNGLYTIVDAYTKLMKRKHDLRLTDPWSLAELKPDDEDYEWLLNWAGSIDQDTIAACCASVPWRNAIVAWHRAKTGFGILLLFLIAEITRREGTEGAVWPAVLTNLTKRDSMLAERLFTQGTLNFTGKASLRYAATQANIGLRHVIGQDGRQEFMATVFLQFGFTKAGFVGNLPAWFSDAGQPVAIRELRYGLHGFASKSFEDLWRSLWNIRHKAEAIQHAEALLKNSPWVLPGWVPGLVVHARRNIRNGEKYEWAAAPPKPVVDTNIIEEGSLKLVVDGTQIPGFIFNLNTAALSQEAHTYVLKAGSTELCVATKNLDGSFHVQPNIRIPITNRQISLTLYSVDSGQYTLCDACDIELWQPEATVFSKSGALLGQSVALNTNNSYWVLCANDLNESTGGSLRHIGTYGQTKIYALDAGWDDGSASLYAENVAVWTPQFQQTAAQEKPKIQAGILGLLPSVPLRLGEALTIKITHPASWVVNTVRIAGKQYIAENAVQQPDGMATTRIRMVTLETTGTIKGTACMSSLTELRTANVSFEIAVPASIGLKVYSQETAEARYVREKDVICLPQNAKVYIPDEASTAQANDNQGLQRHWTLLDCSTVRQVNSGKSVILSDLVGLGEPLMLVKGPYNAVLPEDVHMLAAGVINPGVVKNAVGTPDKDENGGNPGNHSFCINLTRPVQPDPEKHQLQIWYADSLAPTIYMAGSISVEDDGVAWKIETTDGRRICFATLTYDESWLGTWWSDDWMDTIEAWHAIDPYITAQLVRSLNLPVLGNMVLQRIVRLAQENAGEYLAAWVPNNVSGEAGWAAVIRTVFKDWNPTAGQAQACLISYTERIAQCQNAGASLSDLALTAPIVSAKIAAFIPANNRQMWRNLLTDGVADHSDLQLKLDQYNLDMAFITHLISDAKGAKGGNALMPYQWINLSLVMQFDEFRKRLAVDLLQ